MSNRDAKKDQVVTYDSVLPSPTDHIADTGEMVTDQPGDSANMIEDRESAQLPPESEQKYADKNVHVPDDSNSGTADKGLSSESGTKDAPESEHVLESESVGGVESTPPDDDLDTTEGTEPDTFPRDYVEKLRDENAKYRQRAQQADELGQRLHTALAAATGRLQDPSDLPFDQEHLDDPEALTAAVDDLLTRKPHLASRRPTGNVGQGMSVTRDTVDLAGILRSRA